MGQDVGAEVRVSRGHKSSQIVKGTLALSLLPSVAISRWDVRSTAFKVQVPFGSRWAP